jgi:flagellar hook-associated protein 3 FlgL
MSSIPSNLARVPNLLASRLALGNINRTSVDLLRVQQQIATGRSIQRPSDDILKATTIGLLDDRLDRFEQLKRNLSHAAASLGVLDSALEEAHDVGLDAKSLALGQLGSTNTAADRAGQVVVVDQMIQGLLGIANSQVSPATCWAVRRHPGPPWCHSWAGTGTLAPAAV